MNFIQCLINYLLITPINSVIESGMAILDINFESYHHTTIIFIINIFEELHFL
jgi:hypothetical protein